MISSEASCSKDRHHQQSALIDYLCCFQDHNYFILCRNNWNHAMCREMQNTSKFSCSAKDKAKILTRSICLHQQTDDVRLEKSLMISILTRNLFLELQTLSTHHQSWLASGPSSISSWRTNSSVTITSSICYYFERSSAGSFHASYHNDAI